MRSLSSYIFVVMLVMWPLATAIYIRSQFRADVVTIVTPWHQASDCHHARFADRPI